MERIIDRFDKYMEYKGLNANKVTVELGISNGLIGKSRGKGRDMSRILIEDVLRTYTDLSREWLISGKGSMIIDTASEPKPIDNKMIGIDIPKGKTMAEIELETLKKLYEMQEELLKEVRKDRDRLAGLIEEKQLRELSKP
jgi:hypothetical protein